jgi:thiamine biosynthesis lipoprotein
MTSTTAPRRRVLMPSATVPAVLRRARPLLGTLVEIGLCWPAGAADGSDPAPCPATANAALEAGFAAIHQAQACLSRFDPDSDLSRFHALGVGQRLAVRPATQQVLAAAQTLRLASDGLFDISLGSAPAGWWLDGAWLEKRSSAVQLDLGGIGKGHAVDLAVQALQNHGATAGWVNAGGDLRAFGDLDLPVQLRQAGGGVRLFAHLRDGAFATSAFGPGQRARLAGAVPGCGVGSAATRAPCSSPGCSAGPRSAHVSVAAPLCLWADALTKLVAATGDPVHPELAQHGASAWWHGLPT